MRARIQIPVVAALMTVLIVCLMPAASAHAFAEVIDRIIATVNGHIILQSDWDEALCYEALLSNRSLAQFNDDDRRAVLDRLIDRELLREQMNSADFLHATDDEVAERIAEARKLYPQGETDEGWKAVLARYQLSEKDLFNHLRQQIEMMRLVDARLRPAVEIDSKSVEAYYRDQFVPRLKQAGAAAAPLTEVSGKIRELLTQQKVSELLVSWLHTLRSEGQVRIPGVSPAANDEGVQSQ